MECLLSDLFGLCGTDSRALAMCSLVCSVFDLSGGLLFRTDTLVLKLDTHLKIVPLEGTAS